MSDEIALAQLRSLTYEWKDGPHCKRAHCVLSGKAFSLCETLPWGGWDKGASGKVKCKTCLHIVAGLKLRGYTEKEAS